MYRDVMCVCVYMYIYVVIRTRAAARAVLPAAEGAALSVCIV